MNNFSRLTYLALATGILYIVWLFFNVHTPLADIFFVQEAAIFLLYGQFMINHSRRRYQLHGGSYSMRPLCDIFIPTRNEPLDILEQTIQSVLLIDYSNKRIYLLDDSARQEVEQLADKYGIQYLCRPDRLTKAYKAANLNYALKNSYGNFILTLDADQRVRPAILDDLLGHFKNDKIGFVASKQEFATFEADFNNDYLFYNYMQAGKNESEVGMSCGSGVIYRRSALNAIGGFQEWNIVEDLYTTYVMHSHGYKSIYINQSYTIGDAPQDLGAIYKQRYKWALDTLRLFIWKQPLFNRRLKLSQRMHYFELGYTYLVSAFMIPSLYFLNFYSLLTNQHLLDTGIWYLVFRLPSFFLILYIYNRIGQNSSSTTRMWAAIFPVYLAALLRAFLYTKPKYTVNPKAVLPKVHLLLILPQLLTIAIGVYCLIYHYLVFGVSDFLIVNIFWFIVMTYWLSAVFPYAFKLKKNQREALALAT